MLTLRIIGIAVCSALAVKYSAEFYSAVSPQRAPSFDYEIASAEAQRNWLLEQAKPVTYRLSTGLQNTTDGSPTDLEVTAYPAERAIETTLIFDNEILDPRIEERAALERSMMSQWCPRYAQSSLKTNDIEWRITLKEKAGTVVHIKMSGDSCAV